MTRYFLIFFACLSFFLLSGCAASEAAEQDQRDTPLKDRPKPITATPVENGSAVAAKMISPVTGY